MQAPRILDNEADRQRVLDSYAVLDTEYEEAFDDIAKVAAFILGVPIALVSLVDSDRQWFKARYGLDVAELPRDVSFCGHVVEAGAEVIVHDALADERFADNPVVTGDPNVRFYAGMPLRTADGFILGALCAIDTVPREPTTAQLAMLDLLAKQVMMLLEKRRLSNELSVDRKSAVASATQLGALFDVMAEGVVVQGTNGVIVTSNPAAAQILGLTDDQLNGRSSLDPRWRAVRDNGAPFPGNEHPSMVVLATGERQTNVVMGVHKPDGALTWISINARPSRVINGVVEEVITTFHDITPIKVAAERSAIQERLATTGTLVSGVAHEINNPLAFVLGNLDLALEELRAFAGPSPSARLSELLEIVGEARMGADRIRKIVRGLRALSRESVVLQPVDVAAVLETSLSMSLHELRLKASVVDEITDLPPVLGDESRLTQVLVNLVVNAAQAFETSNPETNIVTIRGEEISDNTVRISVIDNGPGIPPELVGRIFDPFFTTKDIGEGTGLGLAVSRGIVTTLGGLLTYEAVPGGGAAFHLDLQRATTPVVESQDLHIAVAGTRGRVLVIDDDASVASTIRRALLREHDVTAVTDPRQVLDILTRERAYDVIFCDLMMPHMTGQQLYERIRTEHPEALAHIVFVTGGATNSTISAFLVQLPNDVIEKPFVVSNLLAVARRYVLRRAQG
jgi:PAS domain S-box-containing protein